MELELETMVVVALLLVVVVVVFVVVRVVELFENAAAAVDVVATVLVDVVSIGKIVGGCCGLI